jgi:serine/threonine protein kinase
MADSDSLIGQTISHYRIIEKLGGGGMGLVYKAEAPSGCGSEIPACRNAARLRGAGTLPTRSAGSFRLELPNICTIYDIGEQDGHQFIAMEFPAGHTLRHLIDGQPLALGKVV